MAKKNRLICTLGVSNRDFALAKLWLSWVSHLAAQPGGDSRDCVLVVQLARNITDDQENQLKAATGDAKDGMFQTFYQRCRDEIENAYPLSANHLFVRTLESAGKLRPGCPILWCEADTVAMKPGWFQEIAAEYARCKQPFMGVRVNGHGHDHMTGNAVYPPDWADRSPLLLNVLSAPDIALWGKGKGQAFDTYSAPDVVSQMHNAKTIQQIWRPKTFTKANVSQVRPETCLFHQCKDGSLNVVLAELKWPDFLLTLPKPTRFFRLHGHNSRLKNLGIDVRFKFSKFRLGIGWNCVTQAETPAEEIMLMNLCGKHGITEVTQADFVKLGGQI